MGDIHFKKKKPNWFYFVAAVILFVVSLIIDFGVLITSITLFFQILSICGCFFGNPVRRISISDERIDFHSNDKLIESCLYRHIHSFKFHTDEVAFRSSKNYYHFSRLDVVSGSWGKLESALRASSRCKS